MAFLRNLISLKLFAIAIFFSLSLVEIKFFLILPVTNSALGETLNEWSLQNDVKSNILNVKVNPAVDDKKGFAACLLVMDDNHFLIEWLAYHYLKLPLRRLIVAIDPKSKTSPSEIFDRYRSKGLMEITEWRNDTFLSEEIKEEERQYHVVVLNSTAFLTQVRMHRLRQRVFISSCLRQLKQENYTWTVLIDTDEYIVLNSHADETHVVREVRPTVMEMLDSEENRNNVENMSLPCITMSRINMGIKEETNLTLAQAAAPKGFNYSDFVTLRYRYYGETSSIFWGKGMVDLSRTKQKEIFPFRGNVHHPIKRCPLKPKHQHSTFMTHHYYGSWEQWSYRADPRKDKRNRAMFDKQSYDGGINDGARHWLNEFVDQDGYAFATELLDGAGQVPKDDL